MISSWFIQDLHIIYIRTNYVLIIPTFILTLSHISLKIFPSAPQPEFFFARAVALLEFYCYITLAWWK